jgi:hypothetical protein|tara:strand:- start:76 stop:804 length:729 start_codon:yes stop_codon:yes gene_type:complete
MIDIENSTVYYFGEKNNYRANVKAILTYKNNNLILTKECRSEVINSLNPFSLSDRNEVMGLVENDQAYLLRNFSVGINFKHVLEISKNIKVKKILLKKNFNIIDFNKIHLLISSGKLKNVICRIDYLFENENYSLITKCEYINFNNFSNSDEYVQPIMGYVPFIIKKEKKVAYAVCNLNKKKNSNLFFIIREKTPLFSKRKNNFFINFFKRILNKCLFFVKKNEFTKVIEIKEYKLSFYENS